MNTRLATCLAAVAFSCAGAPRVGSSAPTPDAWLVWSTTEQGTTTTLWLDAEGTVRGQADGLLVARDTVLYRVTASKLDVPTLSCDQQHAMEDGAPPDPDDAAADAKPSEPGSTTRLELVPVAGGPPIEIVSGLAATTDAGEEIADAELRHAAHVTAALGRYFFVSESTFSYSCGAHGNTSASASVFDLETGGPVTLVDEASLDASRDRARADFVRSAAEVGDPSEDAAAEIHLAASEPVWIDGGVTMRHLFWIDACYACSDGAWSSYSRTSTVDDPALPAAFSLLPTPPAPVTAWLSSHTDPRGVSWGRATKDWAAVLPAPRR